MGWATYPKNNEGLSGICARCLEPVEVGEKYYMVGETGSGNVAHYTCELEAAEPPEQA